MCWKSIKVGSNGTESQSATKWQPSAVRWLKHFSGNSKPAPTAHNASTETMASRAGGVAVGRLSGGKPSRHDGGSGIFVGSLQGRSQTANQRFGDARRHIDVSRRHIGADWRVFTDAQDDVVGSLWFYDETDCAHFGSGSAGHRVNF